MSVVMKLV